MRTFAIALSLVLATPSWAAFEETNAPDLAALKVQIETGGAAAALNTLRAEGAKSPNDANIHNLIGYANRTLGRYAAARVSYEKALALEPAHVGALEYMGELELQTGDPAAARALLARLRAACPDGCHELEDLIHAFGEHGVAIAEGS